MWSLTSKQVKKAPASSQPKETILTQTTAPAAAPTGIPAELKQIVTTLFTQIGAGIISIEKADLQAMAASLQQNKTFANLGLQAGLLQVKAVANAPQDESVVVGNLGTAIAAAANLLP